MSAFLFPYSLQGIQFNYLRTPIWNTGLQKAVSGKQSSIAYQVYPQIQFQYTFEFLRDPADITSLVGLFNAVRGRFDTFLHVDPDFNSVTNEWFGTGDGSTATFQVIAVYQNGSGPGIPEIIQNLKSLTVMSNGSVVPSTSYTVGPTGVVTFTTAPASGVSLTWSGSWYYRCRFDEDKYDWKKIMAGLWQSPKISFTSIIL